MITLASSPTRMEKKLRSKENVNECTYSTMREEAAKVATQVHQQYFHFYKPQKYTHPDIHMACAFLMESKQQNDFKGDWGSKILKELRKAASSKLCIKNRYIGCGPVLTRIAYEAVGMTEDIKPMIADADILGHAATSP